MEGRSRNSKSVGDAARIVAERVTVYRFKKARHVNVQVWVKDGQEADLLFRVFGGSVYRHKTRYYWMLSNRKEQLAFAELLLPFTNCMSRLQPLYAYLEEVGHPLSLSGQ